MAVINKYFLGLYLKMKFEIWNLKFDNYGSLSIDIYYDCVLILNYYTYNYGNLLIAIHYGCVSI